MKVGSHRSMEMEEDTTCCAREASKCMAAASNAGNTTDTSRA